VVVDGYSKKKTGTSASSLLLSDTSETGPTDDQGSGIRVGAASAKAKKGRPVKPVSTITLSDQLGKASLRSLDRDNDEDMPPSSST